MAWPLLSRTFCTASVYVSPVTSGDWEVSVTRFLVPESHTAAVTVTGRPSELVST